jgi:hypothetical protein
MLPFKSKHAISWVGNHLRDATAEFILSNMKSKGLDLFGTYTIQSLRDAIINAFRESKPQPSQEAIAAVASSVDLAIVDFLNQLDDAANTDKGLEISYGGKKLTTGYFELGGELPKWLEKKSHFDKAGNPKTRITTTPAASAA